MTLELLWQEYAERNSQAHYSYNHFCRLYKEWACVLQPSMRQTHVAGEKLFVDYCGQTVPIIDPHSGELLCKAQIFVAVLGASNYTFAEATRSQQLEDWVMSHKRLRVFRRCTTVSGARLPQKCRQRGAQYRSGFEPDLSNAGRPFWHGDHAGAAA